MPQTTDSGAKKILGTDNWRGIFDVHNDTVDAYDGQIAGLQDGLAIIANGNTHAAIASGQFVYVKNHGSLAKGLYKARAAIGANVTLSTSNLAADSAGGLNDLQGQVDSLNSKFAFSADWINNSDLNNYKESGFYMVGTGNANQVYSWGFLVVIAVRSDTILQIQESNLAMAIRECRSGTWAAWKAVSMSS